MRKLRTILALTITFPLYVATGMMCQPFANEWERFAKSLFAR